MSFLFTITQAQYDADLAAEREAGATEVRARVEAVLSDPANQWWHTGGTPCVPTRALRAALNGGE